MSPAQKFLQKVEETGMVSEPLLAELRRRKVIRTCVGVIARSFAFTQAPAALEALAAAEHVGKLVLTVGD